MSHKDGYERENQEDRYYRSDPREYRGRNESFLGETLSEIPLVGELLESFGGGRIGQKGVKKFFYCCAPIALILLIPTMMLVYWIIKSGLSLFRVDISNINWLEQAKSWVSSNLGLDQLSQWFGGLQSIIGQ